MAVAVIRSVGGLMHWVAKLATVKFPVTVALTTGEPTRRDKQNKLAQRWFSDIARQIEGMSHEDARAMCKLHFGVPILRAENEAFCASYDRVFKHLPYEQKLQAIRDMDLPVTRLMTVKQMTAFMDAMQAYWLPKGVRLTDPEALKYEDFA